MQENGLDAEVFAAEFDHWKSLGGAGEDESYFFGKDGGYRIPKVGLEQYALRHVHLVPVSDLVALKKWDRAWGEGWRRTSDRHLVYTSDGTYGHLLMWILDEPGSHDIANMQTEEDRELMQGFATVAYHFRQTGAIAA
ncbi:hypothetical protein Acav_1638 [Paracidovorax avenae ATCC 19860]|uniref:Uncharacterized protein n=2 Tax=Paracidovorax avenae TaxID=80867 RepID=F0Q4Q4_PARA1|nr:hypothetical protein Acav_1638 [Paracidovorax avenae ATCC 19860]